MAPTKVAAAAHLDQCSLEAYQIVEEVEDQAVGDHIHFLVAGALEALVALEAYCHVEVAYQDGANQVEEAALVAFLVVLVEEVVVIHAAFQPFLRALMKTLEQEVHRQRVDEADQPAIEDFVQQEAVRRH